MNPTGRQRTLYRDPTDRMVAGVASGVAKYFDLDPTLVRVVWFVCSLGGFGLLAYLILWVVLEDEPAGSPNPTWPPSTASDHGAPGRGSNGPPTGRLPRSTRGRPTARRPGRLRRRSSRATRVLAHGPPDGERP